MCERIGAMPAPPPIKTISAVGLPGKEFAVGPGDDHLVARLQIKNNEDICPGGASGTDGGGGEDPHVEHDDAFFFRIVGHRIGAHDRFVDFGPVLPEVEFVPVASDTLRRFP